MTSLPPPALRSLSEELYYARGYVWANWTWCLVPDGQAARDRRTAQADRDFGNMRTRERVSS